MRDRLRVQAPIAAIAAVQVALTAVVAAVYGTDGAFSLVAALVLQPVAVWAVAAAGTRLAGGARFGVAAALLLVVLPFLARADFSARFDSAYNHQALPALLGVQQTAAFAVGVSVAVAVALAPEAALAAAGVVAAAVAAVVWGFGPVSGLRGALHETGWSVGLVEWLPVAGFVGAARRSPWLAVALGGWLTFVVARAAGADYFAGAFWREAAPALPAAALLLASIWLLVPRLRPAAGPGSAPTDAP